MHANLYDELWERVIHYPEATLLTLEVDGTLRSDRIKSLQPDFDGSIWFFAAPQRSYLRNIEASPEICINYSDAQQHELASLCGSAAVIRDPSIKQAKWAVMSQSRLARAGETSSWHEATLVRVAVDYAEYWDPYGTNLSSFAARPQAYANSRSERFARGGLKVAFTPEQALTAHHPA